jgi:hypothetical protein
MITGDVFTHHKTIYIPEVNSIFALRRLIVDSSYLLRFRAD